MNSDGWRLNRRVGLALWTGLLLALSSRAVAAPPSDELPRSGIFVGQAGPEIVIGLVAAGGGVRAYACNGESFGAWFSGELDEQGGFDLSARDGVTHLSGRM